MEFQQIVAGSKLKNDFVPAVFINIFLDATRVRLFGDSLSFAAPLANPPLKQSHILTRSRIGDRFLQS
ncbi:MAG TPA: hypothetical protein VFM25_01045, partial [Verrucomicrobiae bacterium]|nr:hypothetical protein [Verrucomicrobiae bacterium]